MSLLYTLYQRTEREGCDGDRVGEGCDGDGVGEGGWGGGVLWYLINTTPPPPTNCPCIDTLQLPSIPANPHVSHFHRFQPVYMPQLEELHATGEQSRLALFHPTVCATCFSSSFSFFFFF